MVKLRIRKNYRKILQASPLNPNPPDLRILHWNMPRGPLPPTWLLQDVNHHSRPRRTHSAMGYPFPPVPLNSQPPLKVWRPPELWRSLRQILLSQKGWARAAVADSAPLPTHRSVSGKPRLHIPHPSGDAWSLPQCTLQPSSSFVRMETRGEEFKG